MFVQFVLFTVLFLQPQFALSQIYKCKDNRGRIIYSEKSCLSNTKEVEGHFVQNVMDHSALRKQIAVQKTYKESVSNETKAVSNPELSYSLMSDYSKELRKNELKIDMKDTYNTYERRADATNEHNYLAKNQVRSLSYEDDLKRKNLKVDLDDFDKSKRIEAMRLLSSIYAKY